MGLKISFPGFKDAKIKEFPGGPVGVHAFTVRGPGLIPGGETKTPQPCTAAKKKKKKGISVVVFLIKRYNQGIFFNRLFGNWKPRASHCRVSFKIVLLNESLDPICHPFNVDLHGLYRPQICKEFSSNCHFHV